MPSIGIASDPINTLRRLISVIASSQEVVICGTLFRRLAVDRQELPVCQQKVLHIAP
jgi:hypothetical protein